jgi:hypothetical protein
MQETTSIDLFFSFNLQVSQVFIFFNKLFAFFGSFIWYDALLPFFLKKIYTRNHQHLFVVCWSLESRASLSIYRLAKSLFFYELFAFLAPYDCSFSFRLANIRLASHLYLFSIKYDLHIYICSSQDYFLHLYSLICWDCLLFRFYFSK